MILKKSSEKLKHNNEKYETFEELIQPKPILY